MRRLSSLRLLILLVLHTATYPGAADAATSVWVMESLEFRLTRLTTGGEPIWTRDFRQSEAIGVDPADASVWATEVRDNTLLKISAVGSVLRHVPDVSRPVPIPHGSLVTLPAFLAVDPNDGSVWVNGTRQVTKFTRAGCELFRAATAFDFISSIAIDPRDGSVWIADGGGLAGRKIVKLDARGREVFRAASVAFASSSSHQVAVDPRDGSVWYVQHFAGIAVKRASDGTLLTTVSGLGSPAAIDVDATDGSVWVADVLGGVVKLDTEGRELIRKAVGPAPRALRINPDDGSVWVGVQGALVILSPNGDVRTTLNGFGMPIALAIADVSEPRLARVDAATGVATGVGARATASDMHLAGQFTVPADIDLTTATVTVKSALEGQCGAGERVRGLPLTPPPLPWNNTGRAGFEDRSTPNFTLVDLRSTGGGEYAFRLKIGDATIEAPESCPVAPLTTTIEIHDALATPLVVTMENLWRCFGGAVKSLRTP